MPCTGPSKAVLCLLSPAGEGGLDLITDGLYRFSRNPAYLSLTLVYLGIGILLDNGWILILVVPVFTPVPVFS